MFLSRKQKVTFDNTVLIDDLNDAIVCLINMNRRLIISDYEATEITEQKKRASKYINVCIEILNKCCEELSITLCNRVSYKTKRFHNQIKKRITEIISEIKDVSVYYDRLEQNVYPLVKGLLSIIQESDAV